MSAEFTCAVCLDTFTKGRSDDETWEEAVDIFGDQLRDGVAFLCDTCWLKHINPEETPNPAAARWWQEKALNGLMSDHES